MGSVQSARRIQHGGKVGGPGVPDPLWGPAPGPYPAPAGRISSAAVRRDRLRVGWEGFGVAGGPSLLAEGVTAPLAAASPCPRGRGRFDRLRALPRAIVPGRPSGRAGAVEGGTGPPAPGATVDWGGLFSVRPDRVAPPGGEAHAGRQGSAAMSVTHPTRLETRTKESNTCASRRAVRNPVAQ